MVYNGRFSITMNVEPEQQSAQAEAAPPSEEEAMQVDERSDAQPVAMPEETAPELEENPWAAWPQPSKAAPGFSVHDHRRFAHLAEIQSEPEESPVLEPDAWVALEPEAAPEEELAEEPWVELQQELRRVGRELAKTSRQAEANRQIFSEVLEELQRLPAVYSETVWRMKAGLLKELLSVVDGVEASLRAGREMMARLEASATPNRTAWWNWFSSPRPSLDPAALLRQWLEGQQLLHRRLLSILHSQGAQEIESLDQRFDSQLHRAVATERRPDVPPGTILAEEVKGYVLDGRVLRYAEVIVSSHEQNCRD